MLGPPIKYQIARSPSLNDLLSAVQAFFLQEHHENPYYEFLLNDGRTIRARICGISGVTPSHHTRANTNQLKLFICDATLEGNRFYCQYILMNRDDEGTGITIDIEGI